MADERCETCGKIPVGANAGSVTSYFFQHNYCQCNVVDKPQQNNAASPICRNCGKGRSTANRVGSFTSFLFKELRCRCINPVFDVAQSSGRSGNNSYTKEGNANNSSGRNKRTVTAARFAKRQQFTQQLRDQRRTDVDASDEELTLFEPGTIIGNTFQIISMIGMGGMGVVYLAKHMGLKSQFALKVLAPDLVNESTWQRFKGEAKTLATLNHPALVKVYDLGIHENSVPFYSMDFLSGRNLEEILMQDGPVNLDRALSIFIDVLDGLAYAHRNGIIHRDIKPANIMLCTINDVRVVKVLDFGISKLTNGQSDQEQKLTVAGDVFGSPYYMSPEQCGGRPIDARSDIYSAGCSLFEVLTSYVPFEGESSVDTMLMHEEKDLPRLRDVAPDLDFPPSLDMVLARCMAKAPRDRYQSAKEVALDLIRIREGKDITAYSPAVFKKTSDRHEDFSTSDDSESGVYSSLKSNKAALAMAAGLVLLMGMVIIPVLFMNGTLKVNTEKTGESLAADRSHASDDTQNSRDNNRAYSSIIDQGKTISFRFPDNKSIGKIGPYQDYGNEREAIGTINFPVGTKIRFQPSPESWANPKLFEPFRAYDLYEISLPYSSTELTDLRDGLKHIVKLEGLGSLNFKASVLGDQQISLLNKLPNLECLNIEMTAVTGNGIAHLKRLRQLKRLNFSYNKGMQAMLSALAGSTAIENLDMDAVEQTITAADTRLIASCPNLRFINLKNDTFEKDALLPLAALKKLEVLNIAHSDTDKQSMARLKTAMNTAKVTLISNSLKSADMATTEGMIKNVDLLPILPYDSPPGGK
jgi:serine/threonine protein kinase